MNREQYQKYLASREWALLREKVRARSNGKCERCWSNNMDAVHHMTYARVGQEDLTDLLAICDPCHEFLSGKSDTDPRNKNRREIEVRLDSIFMFKQEGIVQDLLACPHCGGHYLNYTRMKTFNRKVQDGPTEVIEIKGVNVTSGVGRNPSSRSDGILLYFTCELCDPAKLPRGEEEEFTTGELPWALAISSHKGATNVAWVPVTDHERFSFL